MFTLITIALLSASPTGAYTGRFAPGGIRVEESDHSRPDGRSFEQLARIAISAKATEDHRQEAAERAFAAFQRYAGPVTVQIPRCHAGRVYEALRRWDYLYQTQRPKPSDLSRQERVDFKAACYTMLRSPEPQIRQQALNHLIVVADHTDQPRFVAMLGNPRFDRVRVLLGLGRIGSKDSIPILTRELSGPYAEQAAEALKEITGEKLVNNDHTDSTP